jgi:ERCC4-related helicase
MSFIFDNSKIGAVGEYLKENIAKNAQVDFVSSIFTIHAYNELSKVLNKADKVRFLFNEPTFLREKDIQIKKEVKEFYLNMKNREKSVSEFELEITLKNNLNQDQVASKFHEFIKSNAEVKSVLQSNTLRDKHIYVKNSDSSYLINGANLDFSLEGLGYKRRMLFDYTMLTTEEEHHQKFEEYFQEIWESDTLTKDVKPYLLAYLSNVYQENAPELVYYLTLYHLFNDILINEDDISKIKERTGIHKTSIWNMLYNFQQDAVVGAIKKLELFNGCIIADSVGLGKTFEALAIIKYYELRNDRILVLAPKKLRNNWTSFKMNSKSNILVDDRFNYNVLNHTDLSREFGMSGEIDLEKINWGNYDLLVIDESHNFRNDNAVKDKMTRYQKLMEHIIKSGVKTKVLMLSATPVNNRLADLKNQLRFITEDNDNALEESIGIKSIERTLILAQRRFNDWGELPDSKRTTERLLEVLDYDFFSLLNSLTIARSRKHIQKYYDTKDIGEFPERLKPITIKSDIDTEGLFPSLSSVNGDIAKLSLPIYSPMLYLLPTRVKHYEDLYGQEVKGGTGSFKQTDRERSLVNLMRINILKRMESSVHAFKLTVQRILEQVFSVLDAIELNQNMSIDFMDEDNEDFDDIEIGNKIKVALKDMDLIRYKQDLLADKEILEGLLAEAEAITPERDQKLEDIKDVIKEKIIHNINPNNNKVIVFTSFSDTAEYLYENLHEWIKENFGLASGLITGSSSLKNNANNVRNHFEDILVHFSPKSSRYPIKNNEIDILIATDCISEGQNLQDCDYLINYDIHWNPVRIIQRFGRVDRIGSVNKVIQLVNFWPNLELDEYINLESRVKNRMVMLDLSATGEDDLLTSESKDLAYRKEQLKRLQEEVMDIEDISSGISITDLTLDDYILSLDKFMKENPNVLENYPTGIHAITDITEKIQDDATPGVIFCLKQLKYDADEKAANSLYPYFLVYMSNQGDIFVSNKSPKKALDIYKALSIGKTAPIKHLIEEFNLETNDGQDMSHYTELLEKAVFDIKGIVEQKGVQSLFRFGKSSIQSNDVSGLNDFELISFMVVKHD